MLLNYEKLLIKYLFHLVYPLKVHAYRIANRLRLCIPVGEINDTNLIGLHIKRTIFHNIGH